MIDSRENEIANFQSQQKIYVLYGNKSQILFRCKVFQCSRMQKKKKWKSSRTKNKLSSRKQEKRYYKLFQRTGIVISISAEAQKGKLPYGEVANGELGQAFQLSNLAHQRENTRPTQGLAQFKLLQALQLVKGKAFQPRRGNLHLQPLQPHQIREFRGEQVHFVREELERLEPLQLPHPPGEQIELVLVQVQIPDRRIRPLEQGELQALPGHIDDRVVVGAGALPGRTRAGRCPILGFPRRFNLIVFPHWRTVKRRIPPERK